jgi:hypothetical protein
VSNKPSAPQIMVASSRPKNRDSSVGTALDKGWRTGVLGFDSRWTLGIFLFTTASRTALGPTQPPSQWVPGTLSLGVKRPGHEAHHSPPPTAKVKERVELYLYSPNTLSWGGAQLIFKGTVSYDDSQRTSESDIATVVCNSNMWALRCSEDII